MCVGALCTLGVQGIKLSHMLCRQYAYNPISNTKELSAFLYGVEPLDSSETVGHIASRLEWGAAKSILGNTLFLHPNFSHIKYGELGICKHVQGQDNVQRSAYCPLSARGCGLDAQS